ncbi:hypothetical protein BGX23_002534 [Mortierella sp. AD031]|nr:hypothetical protein BGX23_002534 [Mortierella sp. AD031]
MTSTYAPSEVADSFEDLSSLSSDKDIESLIMATSYDDDDYLTGNSNLDSNNNPAQDRTAEEEESSMDEDFVDIAGAVVEDEADILSEGWEFSCPSTPDSQEDQQDDPPRPSKAGSPLSTSQPTVEKSTSRPAGASGQETTSANTTTNFSSSSIPRMRMSKDIFAAFQKSLQPTPVSKSGTSLSSSTSSSRLPAPRFRPIRLQTTSTSTSSTSTPTPGTASPVRAKKAFIAKRLINFPADTKVTMTPPLPGKSVTQTSVSDQLGQGQMPEEEEEEEVVLCKAIRRSTGKRCTRPVRHAGYCKVHRHE